MIVITDVKYFKTANHSIELEERDDEKRFKFRTRENNSPAKLELIRGIDYVVPGKPAVTIGMTKRVQNIIGIAFDCVHDQSERIVDQNYEIKKLLRVDKERRISMDKLKGTLAGMENKLSKLKRLTIWGRLVFLLTGKI